MRLNLTGIDTSGKNFEALAGVPTHEGSETHGGEDVAAYAIGKMNAKIEVLNGKGKWLYFFFFLFSFVLCFCLFVLGGVNVRCNG